MRIDLKHILMMTASMSIGCTLIGCMLAVIVMKKVFTSPRVVKVDLQTLVARASRSLSLQDVSEAELNEQVSVFTSQLKLELQRLAAQKNLIILNANLVIEGAQDITSVMEERLAAGNSFSKARH